MNHDYTYLTFKVTYDFSIVQIRKVMYLM